MRIVKEKKGGRPDSQAAGGAEDPLSRLEEQIRIDSSFLLELCVFAQHNHQKEIFPCRDFLRKFHMETTRIEELIDVYGAQKNERWFPFESQWPQERPFHP